MAIAFVEYDVATGSSSPVQFPKASLESLAENQAMFAIFRVFSNAPTATTTLTTPNGWEKLGELALATNSEKVGFYIRRATGSEPTNYDFAFTVSLGTPAGRVQIATYSGCITSGNLYNDYSSDAYTTNDATLRGGSVDVPVKGWVVAMGANGVRTTTAADGFTERFDANGSMVADHGDPATGETGNVDFTLSGSETGKHCILVALLPVPEPPATPTISAPSEATEIVPGETVNLTATTTDPQSDQVLYRWKYSKDGGADQTIGDTSLVNSGTENTYAWDTTGIASGSYVLKCWGVDANGFVTPAYDSVTVAIRHVEITAPTALSSHISGTIDLTVKGYLVAAGSIRLQWEIDTANPPSNANADYDLITSAVVAQDTAVTVVGNVSHLDTWYIRARTVDSADAASAWTAVLTFYVLEELLLDSGSQVEKSILAVSNKVYCKVEGAATVGTATNTTTAPTYASSPRERFVTAPAGANQAACDAIATKQLAIGQSERVNLSGLKLSLEDGMKLQRGQQVGVSIERMSIDGTYPIRELVFDVSTDSCEVTVGEFWEVRTDEDALVAIAQKLQSLEKEAAS
jgi:hypothetical protein